MPTDLFGPTLARRPVPPQLVQAFRCTCGNARGYLSYWRADLIWMVGWVSFSYRRGIHYCPFCGTHLKHELDEAIAAARKPRGLRFVGLREAYELEWARWDGDKAYKPETWPEEWFCDSKVEAP